MSDDDILKRLMAKVGSRVSFKYPGGEGEKRGILKDRVAVKSNEGARRGVRFWNVIDLLEFPDATQPWIRFGYYRQDGSRLVWARSSLADGEEDVRRLFVAGIQQAEWFRQLVTGLDR